MKSRKPTFQIVLSILVTGVIIFVAINGGNWPNLPCEKWFMFIAVAYSSAYTAFLALKMRWVEAASDSLYLLKKEERLPVDYKKIKWIFELRNSRGPSYICLKYYDQKMLADRLIIFSPRNREFGRDSDLTVYIRSLIMEANPAYDRNAEPSSWKVNVIMFLVAAIPIALIWLTCF